MTTYPIDGKQIVLQNIAYVTTPAPLVEYNALFNPVYTGKYSFLIVFSKGCQVEYEEVEAVVRATHRDLLEWLHKI